MSPARRSGTIRAARGGTLALLLALSLGWASVCLAEDFFPIASTRLMAWQPPGWLIDDDGDRTVVGDPRGEAVLTFDPLDALGLDDALTAAEDALALEFPDFEYRELYREMDVAGAPAAVLDGGATIQGVAVDLGLMVIAPSEGPALLVTAYATPDAFARHARTLGRIMTSIRPDAP